MICNLLKLLFILTLLFACESQDSSQKNTTNDAGGEYSSQAGSDHMSDANRNEAPDENRSFPGCYDLSIHKCDCTLSEPVCAAQEKVWTEECECTSDERTEEVAGSMAGTEVDDNGGTEMVDETAGNSSYSKSSYSKISYSKISYSRA